MLKFYRVNIFDQNTQVIVNPVNCVGVMGKGLALEFKKRFPNNFLNYKRYCDEGHLKLGTLFEYVDEHQIIINLPTKDHWRDRSRLSSIDSGLIALANTINFYKYSSVCIPKLGCGLGGLNWADVKLLMIHHLTWLDCEIIISE